MEFPYPRTLSFSNQETLRLVVDSVDFHVSRQILQLLPIGMDPKLGDGVEVSVGESIQPVPSEAMQLWALERFALNAAVPVDISKEIATKDTDISKDTDGAKDASLTQAESYPIVINFNPLLFGFLLQSYGAILHSINTNCMKQPIHIAVLKQTLEFFVIPTGALNHTSATEMEVNSNDPLANVPPRRLFTVALLRKACGAHLAKEWNIELDPKFDVTVPERWDFHQLLPGKCQLISCAIFPSLNHNLEQVQRRTVWEKSNLTFSLPDGLLDRIEIRAKHIWNQVAGLPVEKLPFTDKVPPFEQVVVSETVGENVNTHALFWEESDIPVVVWKRLSFTLEFCTF
jgi:hypothetical protein